MNYIVVGMLFGFFILAVLHRVLAFIVNSYIQTTLTTTKKSFDIHIDWISLRIGLDRNEIVINGISFKNPPPFNYSKDFVHINEVRVVFSLKSVIDIFIKQIFDEKSIAYAVIDYFVKVKATSLRLYSIDIVGMSICIEKGKDSNELNLWAALSELLW
jgi:hypothetical protein